MHKAAANLSVSNGVGGKLTCDGGCARQLLTLVSGGVVSKLNLRWWMREAAANLGVSGGVVGKLTCEGGCVRQLLTLVCLVV
jgi:hypothetical protein